MPAIPHKVAVAMDHGVAGRRRRGVRSSIVAAAALLAMPVAGAGAAERPDNVTLTIAGSFPARIVNNGAAAPGTSDQKVDARIEVRGQRVIYTTGDGRFEMRFDGSPAVSNAPAECNGSLTNTPRRTSARAWFAGGVMAMTRFSETKFPARGPCGGLTVSVNETFGIRLIDGRCEFGLTVVRKRGGPRPTEQAASILPWRPCEATPPGSRTEPNVAVVPAPPEPQPPRQPQVQPMPSDPPAAQRSAPPPAPQRAPEDACKATPAGTIIAKCLIVSCRANLPDDVKARLNITEANDRQNLEHIDHQLGSLQALIDQLKDALAKVGPACRGAGGACNEIGVANAKLSDLYYALQKAPEEDIINNTATTMMLHYQQPDCMNQILQQTSSRLDAALDLMQRAEKLGAK